MMETATGAICTICGYANNLVRVRRHLEGKHSIGPGYPCPVCKLKYKTEDTRKRHMRILHKQSFSTAELRQIDEKQFTDAWENG